VIIFQKVPIRYPFQFAFNTDYLPKGKFLWLRI
jgi:hypothetical protein